MSSTEGHPRRRLWRAPWQPAVLAIALLGLLHAVGCRKEVPFAAKPDTAPTPVRCFDGVGHMRGAKPFLLGGTCCCTPTQALFDQYKADGVVQAEMALADLLKLYQDQGIHTALDHRSCNNLCQWGPHVVKGGKCMVPPTPGTANYEEIRYDIRYVPAEKK